MANFSQVIKWYIYHTPIKTCKLVFEQKYKCEEEKSKRRQTPSNAVEHRQTLLTAPDENDGPACGGAHVVGFMFSNYHFMSIS